MEVKLTKEQIDQLFVFTKKKLVHYYDVQIELVDHLAERIQEEMAANKNLSFETALQKVYAGFGIFGFAKVVQEKEKQARKANSKIYWKVMLSFFTWPKISLLAVVFLSLYQLSIWLNGYYLSLIVASLWIIYSYINNKKIKLDLKRDQKPLLILQVYGEIQFLPEIIFISLLFQSFEANSRGGTAFVIMVSIGFLFQATYYSFFQRVLKIAENLYPQAFKPIV